MSMPGLQFVGVCLQIDALCCACGEGGSESMKQVKTELMAQMTAVLYISAHVLMLATINCLIALYKHLFP